MKEISSLRANILYNVGYQVLSIIVPLITAPYISRVLGKDGMGLYGYTFSIAHYFVLFCMLGIVNYGNREVSMVNSSRLKRSDVFWHIYLVQLCMGVVSLGVFLVFVSVYVDCNQYIYYLQGLFIVSGILDISWFYFGIEQFKVTTCISALNKIVTTVLIFLFVKNQDDVWIYTLIIAGGVLLNNVFYWILLREHITVSKIKISKIVLHLKPMLLLFVPVIAVNIYKYIDKIMLGAILNVGEVGIFEAAEKLTNIPMGFIAAIGTVMLPRISSMLGTRNMVGVNRYNKISLNLVMFLSCGMAFGLAGISRVFVPMFYGLDFTNASEVLNILCPSMIFVSWANVVRTQYLLPHRKDTFFCISVILGAIVNIVSNFLLVPRFGASGAAFSTLIAEVVVCFVQSILANNEMHLLPSLISSSVYLAIGLIMYTAIIQIEYQSTLTTVILRVFVGVIIYTLLSYYFVRRLFKDKSKYIIHK